MAEMTEKELIAIVDQEFESAMGAEGGEISKERAKAWDFYLSKPLGNEIEGQSQIVTSDVADAIDGIMPSILRIFTIAENLIDFDPVGEEDEEKAQQESDYVNYVFFKQNPAFLILLFWFFDAAVQKNGIVKAWWDESEKITFESYQGLDDDELADLLDDDELEPIERSEREAETVITDPSTGQQLIGKATVHDIMFRRVARRRQVSVENVPPEEYRISADSRSIDPSTARMVGQEREITRSDLIGMGFEKSIIDELPAHGGVGKSEERISRHDKTDELDDTPHDRSQDKIVVREAYIRVDFDGDGRAELRQIFTSNGRMLSNEPADSQPFHVISPQPLPHKHFGLATAEKVMDVQEVTSTLTRQIHDNLYHTNNPKKNIWEQAVGENTFDDLLTRRAGGFNRFSRPPGEAVTDDTVPFTAGATFPMLEWWEKVKRDRTGISSDGEGLSPEALKNIQTSVLAQATDLAKMKVEAVGRIFSETGLKSLFRHIHELLLKHQRKEQLVKLRNKWVRVNPTEWRTRENMTVRVGLGIGTREQNLLHLNAIWEKQREIVQAGGFGTLVTPRNIFNTAAEIVKNANLKTPEMFFTPTDEISPQSDEQTRLAEMQAQLAARQQELDAQEQALDREKMELQHSRELEKLELQREAESNKLFVAMEEIANKLTELELKFATDVPGSKV